jgi:uncharacterized protein (TIGR03382 family)
VLGTGGPDAGVRPDASAGTDSGAEPPDAGECADCTPPDAPTSGCGCGTAGSLLPMAALGLLALLRRRR